MYGVGDFVDVLWEGVWHRGRVSEVKGGDSYRVTWDGCTHDLHAADMTLVDAEGGTAIAAPDDERRNPQEAAMENSDNAFDNPVETMFQRSDDSTTTLRPTVPHKSAPSAANRRSQKHSPKQKQGVDEDNSPVRNPLLNEPFILPPADQLSPPIVPRKASVTNDFLTNFGIDGMRRVEDNRRERVTLPALKRSLVTSVKHVFSVRTFFVYIVYLAVFSTSAGYITLGDDEATFYMCDSIRDNLLLLPQFYEVESPDDVWKWLSDIVQSLWVDEGDYAAYLSSVGRNVSVADRDDLRKLWFVGGRQTQDGRGMYSQRQNVPLFWLLVRQHRINAVPCEDTEQADPIHAATWQVMKTECWDSYSKSDLNATHSRGNLTGTSVNYTAMTTDPWIADKDKDVKNPPMTGHRGRVRTYHSRDEQFTFRLPYASMYQAEVREMLDDLNRNGWIDFATRVVTFELITYNPTREEYAIARAVVEFMHTGAVTTFSEVRPFHLRIFTKGGLHSFLFVTDCLFAVYLLFGIYEVAWHVRVNKRVGLAWVGFWEVIHIANLVLLAAYLVLSSLVWVDAYEFTKSTVEDEEQAYAELVDYEAKFERMRFIFIAALWVGWIRMLSYVRHSTRLNTVTETIRLASQELFSLCIVTTLIVFSFGLVANALYGWHFKSLATIGDSIDWLVRAVFSGGIDNYDDLRALEPTWTPIFFLVYLILVWLILLNVVLGIIAAGFSAASRTTQDRSWSTKSFRNDWNDFKASFTIVRHQMRDFATPRTIVNSPPHGAANLKGSKQHRHFEPTSPDLVPTTGAAVATGGLSTELSYTKRHVDAAVLVGKRLAKKQKEFEDGQRVAIDEGIIDEWETVEFDPQTATVNLDELMRIKNWPLPKAETAMFVHRAAQQTVESFASQEEARIRKKQDMYAALTMLQQDLHSVLKRRFTGVETRIEQMSTEVESLRTEVEQVPVVVESQTAAVSDRVVGAVQTTNRHIDGLGAAMHDSENRVRSDIFKTTRSRILTPSSPLKHRISTPLRTTSAEARLVTHPTFSQHTPPTTPASPKSDE
ncbi:Polycystin-2 [Diplonema papillatum]|nr:Polycystin-2 [Diplonema papillatum]